MNSKLRDWACSFTGCDGGNINAKTWLCGIEWGFRDTHENQKKYYSSLLDEIENGKSYTNLEQFDWNSHTTDRYGKSFAKLYTAIYGDKFTAKKERLVENYNEVMNLTGDEIFKLNLYPISFNHTGNALWDEFELKKATGFESKYLFNTWCFFNRLPYFNKLREKHKPQLIIGTGVDYLRDFIMAFSGGGIDKIQTGIIKPASERNRYDRTYYWLKIDDQSILVVIPFFSGRYGLNSNHLLQEIGNRIFDIMHA